MESNEKPGAKTQAMNEVIAEIINFLSEMRGQQFHECLIVLKHKGFDSSIISDALNQIMICAKYTDRFTAEDCEAIEE